MTDFMAIRYKPWRDSAGAFALVLTLLSVPTFLCAGVMPVQFGSSAPFDVWFADLSILCSITVGSFCGGYSAYRMGGKEHHLSGRIIVISVLATAFSIVAAAALIVISVLAVRSATGGSIRIAGLLEFFLGAVFFGFMEVGILSLCVTTAWTTLYCALAHR